MSRVFWDTNLFIYLLEDEGSQGTRIARLLERLTDRGDQLFTSALTLGEVLVKPLEVGDDLLCARYEATIAERATVISFEIEAARAYARIRRDRTIRAPDAIQLACASHARIDLFITNDDRLSNKLVDGIQFITSLDRAFA